MRGRTGHNCTRMGQGKKRKRNTNSAHRRSPSQLPPTRPFFRGDRRTALAAGSTGFCPAAALSSLDRFLPTVLAVPALTLATVGALAVPAPSAPRARRAAIGDLGAITEFIAATAASMPTRLGLLNGRERDAAPPLRLARRAGLRVAASPSDAAAVFGDGFGPPLRVDLR